MKELVILVISFFIYGFFGWIWESLILPILRRKRLYNSGFLNGPVIPIYGFGAVFIIIMLDRKIAFPIHSLFIESAVLACFLEYVTSYLMEKLFHRRWWDYSKESFNLNGRICLKGFVCFGVFGVVVLKFIQPAIYNWLNTINEIKLIVLATIFITLILVDTISTVITVMKLESKILQLQKLIDDEINERISNVYEHQELLKKFLNSKENQNQNFQDFLLKSKYIERRLLKAFPNITLKKNNQTDKKF